MVTSTVVTTVQLGLSHVFFSEVVLCRTIGNTDECSTPRVQDNMLVLGSKRLMLFDVLFDVHYLAVFEMMRFGNHPGQYRVNVKGVVMRFTIIALSLCVTHCICINPWTIPVIDVPIPICTTAPTKITATSTAGTVTAWIPTTTRMKKTKRTNITPTVPPIKLLRTTSPSPSLSPSILRLTATTVLLSLKKLYDPSPTTDAAAAAATTATVTPSTLELSKGSPLQSHCRRSFLKSLLLISACSSSTTMTMMTMIPTASHASTTTKTTATTETNAAVLTPTTTVATAETTTSTIPLNGCALRPATEAQPQIPFPQPTAADQLVLQTDSTTLEGR
jgi:hypothetical protein